MKKKKPINTIDPVVSLRLPEEMVNKLKDIKQGHDLTLSQIMRAALKLYIEEKQF